MEIRTSSIIDLSAELAKLTMFRRTPQSTREETKGSVARLASYRDDLLLAIKSSGTDHWERHLTGDELIHVLDGAATLEIVCDDGPPKSFALRAGMMAVIPQGAWHRCSSEGKTQINATPFPGDHIELDVDDPRTVERKPEREIKSQMPSIVDLNAELAKLTMFRGRTPQSTIGDRKGSAARLASYRDGVLTTSKFAGKGHWGITSRRRVDSHTRRHCDAGNRRRRWAAQVFRAPCRNDGCQSAGYVAPLSLIGGRDADDRNTLSQRSH
jgi:mannose-6-phosphate isomerase-like protein (cupin superfamily)